MSHSHKRCLILSSGGDAPGMNAAIRSVTRLAIHYGLDVIGSISGYQGLLDQNTVPLTKRNVGNKLQMGGTLLKTARCPEFTQKETREKAIAYLNSLKVDYLVVLGGNGSFQGARCIAEESAIKTIGIPCTIDNDITGTDYTIGFNTAMNTALASIDKIRDTAFSHDRHFMVEVMGRDTGHLAAAVGIAGGAEIILIPEQPLKKNQLIHLIKNSHKNKATSIIVTAEGGEAGKSVQLSKIIYNSCQIEYKPCILGHIQRGGSPTAKDRINATLMGAKAIEALLEGQSKKMTAINKGEITLEPFPSPENGTRFFSDFSLLETNAIVCDLSCNQPEEPTL